MILGIYLRNIKVYKNINYIPIGIDNFVSYLGENGSGKSSILESLDAFFNNNEYSINKVAKKDGKIKDNFPYFCPIFLIEKGKLDKVIGENQEIKEKFEHLSNYFWSVKESDLKTLQLQNKKKIFINEARIDSKGIQTRGIFFIADW